MSYRTPLNQRLPPSIFGEAEERYQNDAHFRSFVDMCQHCIESMNLTPSEARQAVMLACIKFEMRRPIDWELGIDGEIRRK